MIQELKIKYKIFILKQKYYISMYEKLEASDLLINIHKKLSECSFTCWIFWFLKQKIKNYFKSFFLKKENLNESQYTWRSIII